MNNEFLPLEPYASKHESFEKKKKHIQINSERFLLAKVLFYCLLNS